MPDSIVNAYEESDVLDPRTDAERPSVPPVIKPVDLGPVHVETPVVLSPMAGVTNWPFRVICESYGPDGLYVAEMITARALVARNPKALRLCRFAPSEKIRSLQLYGVNPSIVEQAAKIVIDENMDDEIRVVVIATGFDNVPNSAKMSMDGNKDKDSGSTATSAARCPR